MTRPTLHVFTPTGAMRAWATTLLIIICFGVALGFTIAYVKKVDADAERRNQQREQENIQRSREICGLIKLIDDVNQQAPPPSGPTAETVTKYRAELHRYRVALGC